MQATDVSWQMKIDLELISLGSILAIENTRRKRSTCVLTPQFFPRILDTCNCRIPYGLMEQVLTVWGLTYDQGCEENQACGGWRRSRRNWGQGRWKPEGLGLCWVERKDLKVAYLLHCEEGRPGKCHFMEASSNFSALIANKPPAESTSLPTALF